MTPSRPSIRRRLAVGLALLGLALFGVIGLFEYLAFDRELQRARSQELHGTMAVVLHLIDDTRSDADLQTLAHRLDDVRLGHEGTRVWLMRHDASLLYGAAPAPRLLGAPGEDGVVELAFGAALRGDGVAADVPAGAPGGIARIVVTVDETDQNRLRASLARILGLCLVVGTCAATLLGLALSDRALRPLARISRQANALSASSIGDRLPEAGVDAELVDLVSSFNRALGRIETAFRQQQAFSADVAHELNTPLTTLITGVELALASTSIDAATREFLANSLDELHRLKGIVRDMLFLARADQGAMAARLPASMLAPVIADVIDYHEAAIDEAGLSARVVGDASARVDAMLIKRAVSNLLSNATRYASARTEIVVRIDSADGWGRIAVSNVGEPLSAELMAQMFDRFHRAEPSRSQSGLHHGLGLAIVAAIAKMHGGATFVQSVEGRVVVGFTVMLAPPDGRDG